MTPDGATREMSGHAVDESRRARTQGSGRADSPGHATPVVAALAACVATKAMDPADMELRQPRLQASFIEHDGTRFAPPLFPQRLPGDDPSGASLIAPPGDEIEQRPPKAAPAPPAPRGEWLEVGDALLAPHCPNAPPSRL